MKPCTAARRGGAHGCVCASVLAVRALYRGMAGAGTRGMPEGRGGEIEREKEKKKKTRYLFFFSLWWPTSSRGCEW